MIRDVIMYAIYSKYSKTQTETVVFLVCVCPCYTVGILKKQTTKPSHTTTTQNKCQFHCHRSAVSTFVKVISAPSCVSGSITHYTRGAWEFSMEATVARLILDLGLPL